MAYENLVENRCVLIMSGGVDSTTLLYWLLDKKYEVFCLSLDYGQKHSKELLMAESHCQKLKIPYKRVSVSSIKELLTKSSLIGNEEVPDGPYDPNNMSSTVVPNRNMILLSLAIAYAINNGAGYVFYGAHGGDHALYPDCRPNFVKAMQKAAELCHYFPVKLEAPFLTKSKTEIVKIGLELEVDYSLTWSCYKGGETPCRTCGTCIEREKAFAENSATDALLKNI